MGGFLYYNKRQDPPAPASIKHSLEALEKKQLSDGRSLTLKEIIEKDDFADALTLAEEDARRRKLVRKTCERIELVDIKSK